MGRTGSIAAVVVIVLAGAIAVQADYVCGDVNNDGVGPYITDLTYLVSYLFDSGPAPAVMESANIDGIIGPGGPVDVSDVTYLVAYMFSSGPEPVCGGGQPSEAIIADHNAAADFENIPAFWIDQARTTWDIYYMHTSHGSQIVTGMYVLRDSSSVFAYNQGAGTLSLEEYGDDLGHNGDTNWVPETRLRLNQSGSTFNMVMWSWCGGASDNTEEGINIYLNKVNELEQTYPGVRFIYMTGHLDGSGPGGNLYARNNQIRDYCLANDKILFDFADIESYDPDGVWYPDDTDACNWCSVWCGSHDCPPCGSCAHSHCFNCYQKGRAFWWMMARMAGWDGN